MFKAIGSNRFLGYHFLTVIFMVVALTVVSHTAWSGLSNDQINRNLTAQNIELIFLLPLILFPFSLSIWFLEKIK